MCLRARLLQLPATPQAPPPMPAPATSTIGGKIRKSFKQSVSSHPASLLFRFLCSVMLLVLLFFLFFSRMPPPLSQPALSHLPSTARLPQMQSAAIFLSKLPAPPKQYLENKAQRDFILIGGDVAVKHINKKKPYKSVLYFHFFFPACCE